jgi:hypothetical protein
MVSFFPVFCLYYVLFFVLVCMQPEMCNALFHLLRSLPTSLASWRACPCVGDLVTLPTPCRPASGRASLPASLLGQLTVSLFVHMLSQCGTVLGE